MIGHTKDFGGGITVRANGDKPGRRVHKQYVDVYARTNADGTTVPVRVCWPDGRGFTIDEIIRIDPFGAVIHDAQTAVYTVRKGDTLWGIAGRYGVSLTALIAANPQIKNPNLIYPGDRVQIP